MGSESFGHGMVNVHLINDKFFGIIESWWSKHKSKIPPRDFLPKNGIVVCVDEQPICSAWFYRTDSGVGIMGFVCADPESSKETRDLALNYLAKHAFDFAKMFGISLLYCPIRTKGLESRLSKNGWTKADDGHWIWSN